MIKINLDNLLFSKVFLDLKYKTKSLEAIKNINKKYNSQQLEFLNVEKIVDTKKINDFVKKKKEKYENIVVLWIGWSALWTRAIMQALKWKYYNDLSRKKRWNNPKLYILDNIDPSEIQNLLEVIDLEKTLFIVISKSWATIETLSQFTFFKSKILDLKLKLQNHFVIIAWENSNFKKNSLKEGFEVFDIPESIWGRFSIFTPVWLLPLAFIWIDIDEILSWISEYKKELLEPDSSKNIALLTSMINYHSYIELGKNILVLFPYATNLFYFWEWYKQLLAESLWKWGLGLTPNTAIWVTDQHSQLQLYYDWPNDKILNFIEIKDFWVDYKITKNDNFTFKYLLDTEKYATAKSITDYNKINYSLEISEINEKNIAKLVLLYEVQIAIMADFFGVNAFNQPWVEIGKKIAKDKISQNIWKLEFLEKSNIKNITFIGWWNGQSGILKLFKDYTKKISESNSINYNVISIVAMSDDWRTTWMLMRSFKQELGIHLPPPWDIRRILFTLSKSKYKDFYSLIFDKTFDLDIEIWKLNILELFLEISKELLKSWKLVDLKSDVENFVNKKWEIFNIINNLNSELLEFKLPLKSSIKWHKFWNILMANLYYNFRQDYNKILNFMRKLLEVKSEVLPITTDEAYIKAILKNWEIIKTQDKISNIVDYNSTIEKIELLNNKIIPEITTQVKKSIKNADYIIIWPGDLYTSIIVNFIIKWLTDEIEKSEAKIIYVLNANNKIWETTNYQILDFIEVIDKNLWKKKINYILWNDTIPELSEKQKKKFKNDISVKWWEYLILDNKQKKDINKKYINTKIISWEYINSKDLYRYNENLIKDLVNILK